MARPHWIWKALMVAGAIIAIVSAFMWWNYTYNQGEVGQLLDAYHAKLRLILGALLWSIGFTVRWWQRS